MPGVRPARAGCSAVRTARSWRGLAGRGDRAGVEAEQANIAVSEWINAGLIFDPTEVASIIWVRRHFQTLPDMSDSIVNYLGRNCERLQKGAGGKRNEEKNADRANEAHDGSKSGSWAAFD